MPRLSIPVVVLAVLILSGCGRLKAGDGDFGAPDGRRLEPVGRLDFPPIAESSGLAPSTLWPGVFWTLNDSGDRARIFPVRADGSIVVPPWTRKDPSVRYEGLLLPEAINIDWESIASDHAGLLIIGACGNNYNYRRDLALYYLREPNPHEAIQSRILKKIQFEYPDQEAFPPEARNFDCEALFVLEGRPQLLTKHRSDTATKHYRLAERDPAEGRVHRLELMDRFEIGGQVTGAEMDAAGQRLLVLTYGALWLFERGAEGDPERPLGWPARRLAIRAGQAEAVCFDGEHHALLTNEQRQVFRVALEELEPVQGVSTGSPR